MTTNIDKYKSDLKALVEMGKTMSLGLLLGPRREKKLAKTASPSRAYKVIDELMEEATGGFEREYQRWYTEAGALIRQLLPDRMLEFDQLYKGDGRRKTIDIV